MKISLPQNQPTPRESKFSELTDEESKKALGKGRVNAGEFLFSIYGMSECDTKLSEPLELFEDNNFINEKEQQEYMAAVYGVATETLWQFDKYNFAPTANDGKVSITEFTDALSTFEMEDAYKAGEISMEEYAGFDNSDKVAGIKQPSLLFAEALDLDGNGEIAVEELATMIAYSDYLQADENDPNGLITSESLNAVKNYMMGTDISPETPMSRFEAGEKVSEEDLDEIGNFLAWERGETAGIAKLFDIDYKANSSYKDFEVPLNFE